MSLLLGALQEVMANKYSLPPKTAPKTPKTTWGHHIPAPVPDSSPRRMSPDKQPVSQQQHRALWEGSSALCQLGGKDRAGGGQGVPRLHHKAHMVPCQQVPPGFGLDLGHPKGDGEVHGVTWGTIHLHQEGARICGGATWLPQQKCGIQITGG